MQAATRPEAFPTRLTRAAARGSILVLRLILVFVAVTVQASQGGRSGYSGDPTTNMGATCAVCHAPDGANPPQVAIVGPDTVDAGASQLFYAVIAGGPGQAAGIGIASEGGVGELLPVGADLKKLDGELTHSQPKGFNDGQVAFVFEYVAPNYSTDVTFHVAGNSADGGFDLTGDGIGIGTHEVRVVNGFESPPEPPKPATGELAATLFATGLNQPVAIENAGDSRLFVVERHGTIRILRRGGAVVGTPFLDIDSRVDSTASEKGLLGLAFHPDYQDNGYFYVYYTRCDAPCEVPRTVYSRVSRFRVSANSDIADPGSELVLLEFTQPFSNHNAGDIHFGPSGYLHIASGDGGSGGDPRDYAQNRMSLLGKMLRIDVDNPPAQETMPDCDISGGSNYSIPPGNAFNDGVGGGCDEIFALGLRNPWRFAFDRADGAMWIADVGQGSVEEVNYIAPGNSGGLNLGWRCYEGDQPFNLNSCDLAYLPPVHTARHTDGNCSITGGRVYRGVLWPELHGQYFFTDFCQSSIRALSGSPGSLSERVVIPDGTLSSVSTFGEDLWGEIYAAELYSGKIYRLGLDQPPGC